MKLYEFVKSSKREQNTKILVISLRQAVLKDKRLISNWRLILLLNADYKIIPKIFASRLKKVLPNLISFQQTVYVAQRCINESGRLISDLLSVTKKNESKRVFSDN